jgi:outer membrane protein
MTMHWLKSLTVAAGLAAVVLPASAIAQQAPAPAAAGAPIATPAILVVDVQYIMRESKAAKTIAQQIEQQRQIYTKEISKTETELRAAHDELERQRTILSADAYNQKNRDFQQKVDEYGRNSQQKKQTLEYSHNVAMKQVIDNMIAVVSDIAQERRANLVLPKDAVLLVDKSLDVTAETLQRIDQKLPTVAVNIVSPPQQPTQASATGAAPAAAPSTTKAKSKKTQ